MGWTMAQVTTAVGSAGSVTSQSATLTTVSYTGTSVGSSAAIVFMNGVVYSKAQGGLC